MLRSHPCSVLGNHTPADAVDVHTRPRPIQSWLASDREVFYGTRPLIVMTIGEVRQCIARFGV